MFVMSLRQRNNSKIYQMNTLIEIIKSGEFSINNDECEFQAHYNDYTIAGTVECEFSIDEHQDESVGIMSDSYQLDDIYFWNLKITDNDECEISLNDKELKSVKQDIENYFDKLVQEF